MSAGRALPVKAPAKKKSPLRLVRSADARSQVTAKMMDPRRHRCRVIQRNGRNCSRGSIAASRRPGQDGLWIGMNSTAGLVRNSACRLHEDSVFR